MRAFAFAKTMPLPLTADAPGEHEFCRQTFTSHVECFRCRFRRLGRSALLQARNTLFGWSGLSVRFRVMPAGRGKPVVEVRRIEPVQRVHAFRETVFPYTGDLDIENAVQP